MTAVTLHMSPLWRVISAEIKLRLIDLSRYPGRLVLEIALPILFATMPILLSRTVPAGDVAATFAGNTGTANYVAYLLIGSTAFVLVTRAFWDIAYWLRFEQETGTLEAIYLTPTNVLTLACGVAIYSALRGIFSGTIAYLLGCLLFRVNPFIGNLALAFLFILIGLIPTYALAFMFGSLVLRVKESSRLVALMQWGGAFLMGVYFPLAAFPPYLRWLSYAFPPSWMVNGVRASLLGIGYFFENWYGDIAILWGFLLALPLLSRFVFKRAEDNMRRNKGIGEY